MGAYVVRLAATDVQPFPVGHACYQQAAEVHMVMPISCSTSAVCGKTCLREVPDSLEIARKLGVAVRVLGVLGVEGVDGLDRAVSPGLSAWDG